MRLGEAIDLEWSQVDLEAHEIHLPSTTKTKRARTVDLSVCPSVADALKGAVDDGEGRVFQNLTRELAADTAKRLRDQFGAPASFTWQALRRTCGSF
ncbi:MAG TPA: tyrosine-type recombinase/integrase [Polyangiaceae bacterium]|nr:tyrosine-type recombinase/integrase [Polyangiaceae bacterium]